MARGESYEEFVEKFKPKHTTDDCYTPPKVYEAVKEWAVKEYGWENREIVRPFYPGGDYENYPYPKDCVVIDNPPFSILSKIVRFYEDNHISYFLFAPHKTLLGIKSASSLIGIGVTITYENGVQVSTSFVCSEGSKLRSSPTLYKAVHKANLERTRKNVKPTYRYPKELMTFNILGKMSREGIEYSTDHCEFVRVLDSQKAVGKAIYGSGYLVKPNEKINQAVELLEANKVYDYEFKLSEREQAIVEGL